MVQLFLNTRKAHSALSGGGLVLKVYYLQPQRPTWPLPRARPARGALEGMDCYTVKDNFILKRTIMASIQKINVSKTSDGRLFEDEAEAREHQSELDFRDWYRDNEISGSYAGSRVDVDTLVNWLHENRKMVAAFYGIAN